MFKQYEQFNDLASKCFALEHLSVLDCTEAVEAKDCFSKRLFWHFGHFWQVFWRQPFGESMFASVLAAAFQQNSVLARVFQQERLSKCFSNSILTPFQPFNAKVFQQEIVLAFGCFNTGFLAQTLLAFGCFSKLVFQHKSFSAYERFRIWVFQLRGLFSNCQYFSIF